MMRRVPFLATTLCVFCLLGLGALTLASHAEIVEAGTPSRQTVEPAYEYFMRPIGLGNDYDSWFDAKGPDVGEVKVDADRLPTRVDNSSRPQFPPIYRQQYGTCGQYTAIANIFTYEMNVFDGSIADSDERRFPATFSWNMVNRAESKIGSEAYHGWEVAKRVGIPTVKTYGAVEETKVGSWPNGYDIWRDAMKYRVAGYRYTPALTIEQINEARGWLYDRNQPNPNDPVIGGLLAMDGRVGRDDVQQEITKTIPQGEYGAGEDLWTRWSRSGYGHGMTCVGYDDNIGYDLNGDGRITNDLDINGDGEVTLADWERGAYLIVNSWGKQWSGDGKIYLLYSAMVNSTWTRGNYFGRIEVARHIPRMTLRLKLTCNDRENIRMAIGLSNDPQTNQPEHTIAPEVFNGWPIFGNSSSGNVPMAGPDDNTPLEVGIDLTPLLNAMDHLDEGKGRLFLKISGSDGSQVTGRIHEAAVRHYDMNGELIKENLIGLDGGKFSDTAFEVDYEFMIPH